MDTAVSSSGAVAATTCQPPDENMSITFEPLCIQQAGNYTEEPFDTLGGGFMLVTVPFSTVLNGYIAPFSILVTLISNIIVCLVLIRPNMRTATNAVLVAVAFSDSMTGLASLPILIYFYMLEGKSDWVPYKWCFAYFCLFDYVPTVFHTASVWLTVLLAGHRYVCVCRGGELPKTSATRQRSCIIKIIVGVFAFAVVSQAGRFFEHEYSAVNLTSWQATSLEANNSVVEGCRFRLTPFIMENEKVYFTVLFIFRILFVHLLPSSALLILTALLVCALRTAQHRKRQLMENHGSKPVIASQRHQPLHQRLRSHGSNRRTSLCSVSLLKPLPSTIDSPTNCGVSSGLNRSPPARRHRSGSRTINDGNNTTMMLVIVVGIFLVVEFPLAVLLVVVMLHHTFEISLMTQQNGDLATMIVNLTILLSYPTNFFIYCTMSRAFRTTFCSMFCSSGSRRGGVGCCRLRRDDNRRRSNDDGGMETFGRSAVVAAHVTQPSIIFTGCHQAVPLQVVLPRTEAVVDAEAAKIINETSVYGGNIPDENRGKSSLVSQSPQETGL